MPSYREILNSRLVVQPGGRIDVLSKLKHFALINYALPKSRLERYIPEDRFIIPEFRIGGEKLAMMSAVPFFDEDFHFIRIFPFLKFSFGQTNYRVYVIDRESGEHVVWFFGTTLGGLVVYLPKSIWRIPWHYANYRIDCDYDSKDNRYRVFEYLIESKWAAARIKLEDTGEPVSLVEGFSTIEEMQLILTHPIDGYFYRSDKRVGSYSVWHQEIPVTLARSKDLYFSLFERLGLLSKEEMQEPHSVFLCPLTEFKVLLPPRVVA
jgi:hypothetical protein